MSCTWQHRLRLVGMLKAYLAGMLKAYLVGMFKAQLARRSTSLYVDITFADAVRATQLGWDESQEDLVSRALCVYVNMLYFKTPALTEERLTSGQGMGVARVRLPKKLTARKADIVTCSCILHLDVDGEEEERIACDKSMRWTETTKN